MSKRFCKISTGRSEFDQRKQKNQIKHPPNRYLGEKRPGMVLFEILVGVFRRWVRI